MSDYIYNRYLALCKNRKIVLLCDKTHPLFFRLENIAYRDRLYKAEKYGVKLIVNKTISKELAKKFNSGKGIYVYQ